MHCARCIAAVHGLLLIRRPALRGVARRAAVPVSADTWLAAGGGGGEPHSHTSPTGARSCRRAGRRSFCLAARVVYYLPCCSHRAWHSLTPAGCLCTLTSLPASVPCYLLHAAPHGAAAVGGRRITEGCGTSPDPNQSVAPRACARCHKACTAQRPDCSFWSARACFCELACWRGCMRSAGACVSWVCEGGSRTSCMTMWGVGAAEQAGCCLERGPARALLHPC